MCYQKEQELCTYAIQSEKVQNQQHKINYANSVKSFLSQASTTQNKSFKFREIVSLAGLHTTIVSETIQVFVSSPDEGGEVTQSAV